MNKERLYLTAKDIYDADFNIDTKGYRPQEVDKLLDMVIKDYTEYNRYIDSLENKLREIAEENTKLKSELRKVQSLISSANESHVGISSKAGYNNLDLLKRISNLEKIVYGKED